MLISFTLQTRVERQALHPSVFHCFPVFFDSFLTSHQPQPPNFTCLATFPGPTLPSTWQKKRPRYFSFVFLVPPGFSRLLFVCFIFKNTQQKPTKDTHEQCNKAFINQPPGSKSWMSRIFPEFFP